MATDRTPTQMTITTVGNVTEITDEPMYGHNFDLPHAQHLVDQGFDHIANEHLVPAMWTTDGRTSLKSQMDDTDFRERCVVQGRSLAVLHLKGKSQLKPKTWLRAEYLTEKVRLPIDVAVHLVAAFRKLSITSWPVARQLLQGVVASGKIWTPNGTVDTGLAGARLRTGIKHAKDPIAAALRLIDIATALDEPQYALDEPEADLTYIDQMYADSMTYGGFEIETGYEEDGGADDEMNPLDEPPIDDNLDLPGTDNPYSTHRLFDGTDSLPYEFDLMIHYASLSELKQLAAEMHTHKLEGGSKPTFEFSEEQRAYYRQVVGITDSQIDLAELYIQDSKAFPRGTRIPKEICSKQGIRVPKHWWFFSKDQIKHFWALYNARKTALEQESLADSNYQRVTVFIARASKREAAAAIYAYRDGRSFDLYGIETVLDGEQIPSKATLEALWTGFKQRFAQAGTR